MIRRTLSVLFPVAAFASAAQMFWVEPLIGKLVLPLLGGTPAVWNGCVAFFQAALLAGYALAHLVVTRLTPRAQAIAVGTFASLTLVVLPLGLEGVGEPPPDAFPLPWLVAALARSVGLPFLLLAMTSPLVQRWWAAATGGKDPYWLSVASNAGSLAGLIAFPFLLEPLFGLAAQRVAWSVGFALAALLLVACGAVAAILSSAAATAVDPRPIAPAPIATATKLRWLALSAVPSSLLLGFTTHVTTDVSPIPLLWTLPLALYLVTFMLAFGARDATSHRRLAPILTVLVAIEIVSMIPPWNEPAWAVVAFHAATFFVGARVLHGELAASRPGPEHLTGFYLWVSLGGVLGGGFNAFLAPLLFSRVLEYPLVLVLTLALVPGRAFNARKAATAAVVAVGAWLVVRAQEEWALPLQSVLVFAVPVVFAFVLATRPRAWAIALGPLAFGAVLLGLSRDTVTIERSFYAMHRVTEDPYHRMLLNGRISHGLQRIHGTPEERRKPLLYYHPDGPAGDVFRVLNERSGPLKAGLVGLGAGALASYGRAGDDFTFFEIDPAIVGIARNEQLFTYLSGARGKVDIVMGDARLTLAKAPDPFDLLLIDAFGSDAIPMHLMTTEAFERVYLPHLATGGRLVVHLSNRYLSLTPVVACHAAHLGLTGRVVDELRDEFDEHDRAQTVWAVLARTEEDLAGFAAIPRWKPLVADPACVPWTDDFTNILQVFAWDPKSR